MIRVKEQVKAVQKAEIQKFIINTADGKDKIQNYDLVDVHQNYQEKNSVCHIGGYFQQLFHTCCAIVDLFDSELKQFYIKRQENPLENNKAHSPRELLLE